MKPSPKHDCLEDLRTRILSMDVPPGSDLDEAELSERYAISRTPLREVLHRLAGEGYVTLSANRGAKVASMDLERMRTFFQTAPLIYSSVARMAAENRTRPQLDALKAAQSAFAAAVQAASKLGPVVKIRPPMQAQAATPGPARWWTAVESLVPRPCACTTAAVARINSVSTERWANAFITARPARRATSACTTQRVTRTASVASQPPDAVKRSGLCANHRDGAFTTRATTGITPVQSSAAGDVSVLALCASRDDATGHHLAVQAL